MQISISEVKRQPQKSLAFEERLVFPDYDFLMNHTVTGVEPFTVKGKVYSLERKLWIHFAYEGMVHFVCDRCLTPFDLLLKGEATRELSEVDEFDVEWLVIRDGHIDLFEALTDDIVVQLPIQLVCSEACLGLCPHCGINLNQEECSCSQEKIDPRLEGLKNFFK